MSTTTQQGQANSNQSAVLNAPSVVPFEQLDLQAILQKLVYNAPKKLDVTRVKVLGTQTSLRDRLKREVMATYPMVYGKGASLPDDVWQAVCRAVDVYIQDTIAKAVHPGNFVGMRRQYKLEKSGAVVMANTVTGHDVLDNRQAVHGASCIIATTDKRIKSLELIKRNIGKAWTPEQETQLANARQKLSQAKVALATNKAQIVAGITARREQSARDKAAAFAEAEAEAFAETPEASASALEAFAKDKAAEASKLKPVDCDVEFVMKDLADLLPGENIQPGNS